MSIAYKWTVLSNTSLGALIASIDMTIVLISLPDIFRGLHINPGDPSNFVSPVDDDWLWACDSCGTGDNRAVL